ncbi:MAG: hypothetical protein KC546_18385, partial [Anaerolineae bacterium]|nr:hypothetical protein [Anaerolineae bacterium]
AQVDLEGYLNHIVDFVQDHFGFRQTLVEMNSWLTYFVFGASTSPTIVLGRDGWLFINSNNGGFMAIDDYYRGVLPPLTDTQLEAFRLRLETRRDHLAALGINYYFVVTPDKHTIYNQYLPDGRIPVTNTNWLDQITEYFQQNSDLVFIDMRADLLTAAKASPETYYYFPLGTHWTGEGAWIGYQTIMERLQDDFPDVTLVNRSDFVPSALPDDTDLAKNLGLSNWITSSVPGYLIPSRRCAVSLETEELNLQWNLPSRFPNGLELQYYHCEIAPNPQTVLFFRDSFTIGLRPFFAETFETTAFVWTGYTDDLMTRISADLQPDIVIEQSVERFFIPYVLGQE